MVSFSVLFYSSDETDYRTILSDNVREGVHDINRPTPNREEELDRLYHIKCKGIVVNGGVVAG